MSNCMICVYSKRDYNIVNKEDGLLINEMKTELKCRAGLDVFCEYCKNYVQDEVKNITHEDYRPIKTSLIIKTIDCKNNEHDFECIGHDSHRSYYKCTSCGHTDWD